MSFNWITAAGKWVAWNIFSLVIMLCTIALMVFSIPFIVLLSVVLILMLKEKHEI
jgi:hypothetical protein